VKIFTQEGFNIDEGLDLGMRWGLLGVRLGVIGVNIVILVIIVLSVLPLAMGGLEIDIPEDEGSQWTADDVISFSQPVRIYNGGYYDIEDFVVYFHLEDSQGNVISDYRNMPVDINAGRRTTVNIAMEIDPEDIGEEEMRNLVFNGTTFEMLVELEAKYMMRLMEIHVNHTEEMEWEPLIRDYGINLWGVYAQYNGSQMELVAPFFVDASEILNGQTVNVECILSNGTSVLGTDTEIVTLQQFTEGDMSFLLSEEATDWLSSHSDELTFTILIEFDGVEAQQVTQYYWTPPGGM